MHVRVFTQYDAILYWLTMLSVTCSSSCMIVLMSCGVQLLDREALRELGGVVAVAARSGVGPVDLLSTIP